MAALLGLFWGLQAIVGQLFKGIGARDRSGAIKSVELRLEARGRGSRTIKYAGFDKEHEPMVVLAHPSLRWCGPQGGSN
jgi:hypothetical protein